MYDRIAFTWLPMKDVTRTRTFYETTLGLTIGLNGGGDSMNWVEYDLPNGGCLALFDGAPDMPLGGNVVFEVLDLAGEMARLKRLNVVFTSNVIQSPVCQMVGFTDPDGNQLMLHQLHDQTRIRPALYGLIGKFTATPGDRDALQDALPSDSRQMPGCKRYDVRPDASDPDVLWVTEQWVSEQFHSDSLTLEYVQAAIGKGRPFIAGMERVATTG
jgi:quinol monooxygenase YgiN/predicted enzyme related to lactoylglutathione lyase